MDANGPDLALRGVSKRYPGGISGLDRLDLDVRAGELAAIVGASGSGKSSLLRTVAGLEPIDAGSITLGGRRIDRLSPMDRDAALVFQMPLCYPHLTVAENLAFGLRARRRPRSEVRERVAEVAAVLGLTHLLGRRPPALSGGERQRVALGRAVARRPALLLLDEPFSSLDAPLRAAARGDLVAWQRRWGITTLLVTHDQAEALAVGDRVAVLDAGAIAQVGTPREVYDAPASRLVARFLGSPPTNLLPARIGDRPVDLGVRPEHVRLVADGAGPPDPDAPAFRLAGVVGRSEFQGDRSWVEVATGCGPVVARVEGADEARPGSTTYLAWDRGHSSIFDRSSGLRIGGAIGGSDLRLDPGDRGGPGPIEARGGRASSL